MTPVLIIFAGLPGTGKTTLAKKYAAYCKLPYFRLDTIEHGLKEICSINVQGEGYRLTYRIVEENLLLGNNVVVDCCNPIELTRTEWQAIAIKANSEYINIEITCDDKKVHKDRAENRGNDIDGFELPSWKEIEIREYHKWNGKRINIDTSNNTEEESFQELLEKVKAKEKDL